MPFHLTSTHCRQSRPVLVLRSLWVPVRARVRQNETSCSELKQWPLSDRGSGGEMERHRYKESRAVKTWPSALFLFSLRDMFALINPLYTHDSYKYFLSTF